MDIAQNNKVSLSEFHQVVSKEPNLLEVFDVLNKGLTQTIDQDNKTVKLTGISSHLAHIITQIDMLLIDLQGHNIILKKLQTNEMSPSVKEMKKCKLGLSSSKKYRSESNMNNNISSFYSEGRINGGFNPTLFDYKLQKPLPFNKEEEEFFLKDEFTNDCSDIYSKKNSKRDKFKQSSSLENPSSKKEHNENFSNKNQEKKLKRSITPQHKSKRKFDESVLTIEENEKMINSEVKNNESVNSGVYESVQSKTVKIIERLKEIKESVKSAQFCLGDFIEKGNTKRSDNDGEKRDIIEEFRYY